MLYLRLNNNSVMTEFNPNNQEELTFHEIFEQALKIRDKEDARQYLQSYSRWIVIKSVGKPMIKEPIEIAKENLGYWAGYYSHDTRHKVETLFECEHPVFGSIAKNGAPTAEQAFKLGLEMGKKSVGRS